MRWLLLKQMPLNKEAMAMGNMKMETNKAYGGGNMKMETNKAYVNVHVK